jgi:hypothetical protein
MNNKMTVIKTKDFTPENWQNDYNYVLDYLKDHIEKDYAQNTFIEVEFADGESVRLTLFDYIINIIMWYPLITLRYPILKTELFFPENLTKKELKNYIDKHVVIRFREQIDNTQMNIICADLLDCFKFIRFFGFYLSNTISLTDDIALMESDPEVYDYFHTKLAQYPIPEIKRRGQEITNKLINKIKENPWHGLSSVFKTGEIINPKQYRPYAVNIGTSPDGKGGVLPITVDNSYINGGLSTIAYNFVDYTGGRLADIIKSKNVGDAGDFARRLALNNSDLILHEDPNYVCDSENFIPVHISNEEVLSAFKMRYYRFNPKGMEYCIDIDYKKDLHLIGQTIYLRSPMTCSSAAKDNKVCHRCYGKLAITNKLINAGSFAVKALSSGLTQKLIGAKHVLDTIAQEIVWDASSAHLIAMDGNIVFLNPKIDFTGCKFVIEPESISLENEFDNATYNESIDRFFILFPNGEKLAIMTAELDRLYITNELNTIIRLNAYPVNRAIVINCEELIGRGLVLIKIKNDDLSKTLNDLKHIIDLNEVTTKHTLSSIIADFLETSFKGGISLDNIHMEMILANQIRSIEDELLKPEWEFKDEPYKLITLSTSLNNNPNIFVAMSAGTLKPQLYNPLTFRKSKSSFMDTFFMEQPQVYLKEEIQVINGKTKQAWED